MGVGPADLDRPVAGQLAGGEQRGAADQQVAVPGEAEAALDEDLPAVGGDDLAGGALELEAVQGVAGRALVGRLRRPRPGRRAGRPGRTPGGGRRGGERRQAREVGDGVLPDLGDAPVVPAGDGPARRGGLQDDRRVVPALEVGQGVQRQGDRLLGPVGCRAGGTRRPGRPGGGGRAARRPGRRGGPAAAPAPCGRCRAGGGGRRRGAPGLAARDRDHGRGVLRVDVRRPRAGAGCRRAWEQAWPSAARRGGTPRRRRRGGRSANGASQLGHSARRAGAVGALAGVEGGPGGSGGSRRPGRAPRARGRPGRRAGPRSRGGGRCGATRRCGGRRAVELGLGHGRAPRGRERPRAARHARRPGVAWGAGASGSACGYRSTGHTPARARRGRSGAASVGEGGRFRTGA